jgi:hypothetical protein
MPPFLDIKQQGFFDDHNTQRGKKEIKVVTKIGLIKPDSNTPVQGEDQERENPKMPHHGRPGTTVGGGCCGGRGRGNEKGTSRIS